MSPKTTNQTSHGGDGAHLGSRGSRPWHFVWAVTAAAVLSGCAPPGPRTRGPDHPLPRAEASASPSGSPRAAGRAGPALRAAAASPGEDAPSLTLEQVLEHSETHSPLLRVSRARADASEADVAAARVLAPHNPEATASFGARHLGNQMFLEMAVSLEQRLEVAGERGARIDAARSARDLAHGRFALERWQLRHAVRCLFHRSVLGEERVAVAERLVGFAEGLHDIAERRVEAGDESPLILVLAHAEVAQARQALVAARQRLDSARFRLAEVAGFDPSHPPELAGQPCPARQAPPAAELLELASRHHPSFQVRSLAVRAAEARLRAEERDAWPEPSIGASYVREGDPDSSPHVWLVTLGLPLPLWDRNQGARARARADLEVARAEEETLSSVHASRIARSARAVDAAAERVSIFGTDILPAFEDNLARIGRAYEAGELDIHQVSQTRQRLIEGQLAALEAMTDYFDAASELQELVGAPVWAEQEEP